MKKAIRGKKTLYLAVAVAVLLIASYIIGLAYTSRLLLTKPKYQPVRGPEVLPAEKSGAPSPAYPRQFAGEKEATPSPGGEGGAEPLEVPPRKVVYTARMKLLVGDVNAAVNAVYGVASKYGGYVASANLYKDGYLRAVITIKVPVESYRDALADLKTIGEVDSFSEQAQDVTERYVDLEARLRNLKAEEQRLLSYLEKAKSISEILQVEDHLARIRSQIEWIETQLKNLERRVDYATITVSLEPKSKPEKWPGLDLGRVFRDAVQLAFTVFAGLIILAVGLSPLYLVGLAAYYVYKRVKGPEKGGGEHSGQTS